jgi:hypothetical protein
VLSELCCHGLLPELCVASLSDRELRERLRRRAHLLTGDPTGDSADASSAG